MELRNSMAMLAPSGSQPGKRKEIYKYEAPWTIYGMNWSVRTDKRFRLAMGSFVEEYNNKVSDNSLFIIIVNLFYQFLVEMCVILVKILQFAYKIFNLQKDKLG